MSYAKVLQKAKEGCDKVTVDRAGASSITGLIESIDKTGTTLKIALGPESATSTYVELTSIRGISTTGWDMDAIAK